MRNQWKFFQPLGMVTILAALGLALAPAVLAQTDLADSGSSGKACAEKSSCSKSKALSSGVCPITGKALTASVAEASDGAKACDKDKSACPKTAAAGTQCDKTDLTAAAADGAPKACAKQAAACAASKEAKLALTPAVAEGKACDKTAAAAGEKACDKSEKTSLTAAAADTCPDTPDCDKAKGSCPLKTAAAKADPDCCEAAKNTAPAVEAN